MSESPLAGDYEKTRWMRIVNCALGLVALAMILAAFWLFYRDYTSPVRELASAPGIQLFAHSSKPLGYPHEVSDIEIRGRDVTANLLKPTLDLPRLRGIFFHSCRIEPDARSILTKCTSLEAICFDDCEMNVEEFVAEAGNSMDLEIIGFRGTKISPGDFNEFGRWANVRRVILSRIKIDGDQIREIAKAKHLEELILTDTKISDEIIAALVETDVCQRIDLTRTDLNDSQLSELCKCRKLKYLDVTETGVTPEAIPRLTQSHSLRKVFAHRTALGHGFDETALQNGCVVYGSGDLWESPEQ